MLLEKPYTQSADIWSAGVLLFAIAAKNLPFEDSNLTRLIQKILNEDPEYPSTFSPALTDLLQRMLTKDPNQRISLDGIQQHPWFTIDSKGCILTYNFSAIEKYRIFYDPSNFTPDPEIVNTMESFGVDTSGLVDYLLANVFNPITATYKILLRNKNVDEMEYIMNDVILKRTDRVNSLLNLPGSSHRIGRCGELSRITSDQRNSSLPTINRIPSRSGNQLISLLKPLTNGSKEKLKMRSSIGQPKVLRYGTAVQRK